MLRVATLAAVAALTIPLAALSAGIGDAETIRRVPESKHTVVDGIHRAEQANDAAISTKFEFEDGKFWLSVYTAKDVAPATGAQHTSGAQG